MSGVSPDPLATAFADAPWWSDAQLAAFGPTLVVAPHPDDESLGCGGLVASLRRLGVPVSVLVVSDGSASHPNSRRHDAAARRALRQAELLEAAAALGVCESDVAAMALPDGALPGPAAAGFDAAVDRLRRHAAAVGARMLIAPWRRDPHPDHRAVYAMTRHAMRESHGAAPALRLLEFFVWTAERGAADELPRWRGDGSGAAPARGWRLDITRVLAAKRHAIAAHRSQHGTVITDDPQGFVLPASLLTRAESPVEYYVEAHENAA